MLDVVWISIALISEVVGKTALCSYLQHTMFA